MGDLEEVDVAIVGGGVAGCYAGYRLSGESPRLTVALFEGSGRIGGRLWSPCLPGLPNVCAELGGMRFHEQIHLVSDLLRHLGLEDHAADFSFGEPENFTYTRGVRFRQRELTSAALARDPDRLPYRLRPAERGKSLDDLTRWVADAALTGFSTLREGYHAAFGQRQWAEVEAALGEYERRKYESEVAGTPLHVMSWWGLLDGLLSREAIHFIQDTGGYDTLASNGNAANWLDVIFYTPPDVRHRRLAGGFEALPRALHERYQAAGGHTRLRHRLLRFDPAPAVPGGSPAYDLLFRQGDGDAGPCVLVRARKVVLALPQRALELVEQDNFFFREARLRSNLQSVRSVGAVKLFLAYPSPWWEEAGVTEGRSTTDLPLRQLWYWGTEAGAPGGEGPALILAAYANGAAAEYWRGLQAGEPYADVAGDLPSPPLASRQMVMRAHAMLLEVHGVERAPLPLAARWQDWSVDPFGGGWHVWREGADARRIIPAMRQPLSGENVFIASDCWSHEPGSVQGSLSSAECVLQDHLGLSWPHWLRREGTRLGPRRQWTAAGS
jgi:hypothetical protein